MDTTRRSTLAGAGAIAMLSACGRQDDGGNSTDRNQSAAPLDISVPGATLQGSALVGAVQPGSTVSIGEASTVANADGRFVVGFDRDAPNAAVLRIAAPGAEPTEHAIAIAARVYDDQDVQGVTIRGEEGLFPRGWFDPTGEATDGDAAVIAAARATRSLSAEDDARIGEGVRLKNAAFASRDMSVSGFSETWVAPVRGTRISSPWGASRRVNTPQGRIRRIHYGIDIAAPLGREILAPAAAKVVLAEPDLYYEGGCVFLDHGQGLISLYLHMMKIDVRDGDVVSGSQPIGAVGATGRATGPHLCWRMKWRDANLDPTSMLSGGVAALTAR